MALDTKYKRQVAELFPQLPELTDAQKEWARSHRPNRFAYYCKGEIWCPDCGGITLREIERGHIADIKEPYVCPQCGTKSTLVYSRRTEIRQEEYFTLIQTVKDWHVVRHFLCDWFFGRAEATGFFEIKEVVQHWITADGRHEVFVARPRYTFGYRDSFILNKPMKVRAKHGAYYIASRFIYPRYRVHPIVRRNGFCIEAARIMPAWDLICRLPQSDRYPHLEMLIKIGQYSLAAYLYSAERFSDYAAEIRICHRNAYKVQDAQMWVDYVNMLRRFGYDTHNAHYVCPRNLKEAHDRLTDRINRERQRKQREEALKRARQYEESYRRDKMAYLGIAFGDEVITVRTFQSVAEIAAEGAEMHHCVYASKYFSRKKSLLMSATDSQGRHVETIEIDLEKFEVAQSRGKYNMETEHHDRILSLCARYMPHIRRAAQAAKQMNQTETKPNNKKDKTAC